MQKTRTLLVANYLIKPINDRQVCIAAADADAAEEVVDSMAAAGLQLDLDQERRMLEFCVTPKLSSKWEKAKVSTVGNGENEVEDVQERVRAEIEQEQRLQE